jgi:hypothetical protein
MKQRCLACGVEKDISAKELYPYPDDGIVDDVPIRPLFSDIHCEPSFDEVSGWRVVTVCHNCFHKLDVDMWISERCWLALNPITPFKHLPKLQTT